MVARTSSSSPLPLKDFVADCNLRWFRAYGFPLREERGCVYGDSGLPFAWTNAVVRCSVEEETVEAAVEDVFAYFERRKLPHSWFFEASSVSSLLKTALEGRGMVFQGEHPGMILTLSERERSTPPVAGFQVTPVSDEWVLREFTDVLSGVFHFTGEMKESLYSLFRRVGWHGPFYHLVGRGEDRTTCTGSLLSTDHGAYIFNVATLPQERKKGHGGQLMGVLLDLAQQQRHRHVALVSSPEAKPFYASLGFKTVCPFHLYLPRGTHP